MVVVDPSPSSLPTVSSHRSVVPGAKPDVEEAADDEEDDAADGAEDCA